MQYFVKVLWVAGLKIGRKVKKLVYLRSLCSELILLILKQEYGFRVWHENLKLCSWALFWVEKPRIAQRRLYSEQP